MMVHLSHSPMTELNKPINQRKRSAVMSDRVPLLSAAAAAAVDDADACYNATDKTPTSSSSFSSIRFLLVVKWGLKILMCIIFFVWIMLCFLFPTDLVQPILHNWSKTTTDSDGTLFRTTDPSGSVFVFLMFGGPLLIITLLAIPYLHLTTASSSTPQHHHNKKNKTKFMGFRLSTFPIIIDGPFGIVSAAELIGILLFTVYIIWLASAFTIQNLNLVLSELDLPFKHKSILMLRKSGRRLGTIGLFCLAFLFLPVARGSFLLRLISVPFEHATKYHVWLGHLTLSILTLHGVFYLLAWTLDGRLLRSMLHWHNYGVAVVPGEISLFVGLLMWLTSFYPVRKKHFELFFYTHQLYVVFAVFLALHVGDFIFSIVAAGMFLYLLDRFLRFCQSRKTVKLISATCLPCGTLELVLSKPENMRYSALSFIFLQVRELSWLQWHPFSVSSSPLDGKHHVSVLIKVFGEWTRKLGDIVLGIPQDHLKEFPSQPHSRITASVEGPYGHESSYHLTYRNLILVAGGIGISPFLAVLRDILNHIAQGKTCIPQNVLMIWAVKGSKELSLLSSFNVESICPFYSDKLSLKIQTYVTQESDPPLEDGEVCNSMNCSYFPIVNSGGISGLVGTGNNMWSGMYVLFSTFGFVVLLALVDLFYIDPSGISSGWLTGLLFVTCMIASVLTFGTFVVVLWYLWERVSSYDKHMRYGSKSEETQLDEPATYTAANLVTLGSLSTVRYGCRPNFQEIFSSVSDSWGHVDVGVIVCGPPGLQSSVAKECRSQNLKGRKKEAFFHFNSHNFDL